MLGLQSDQATVTRIYLPSYKFFYRNSTAGKLSGNKCRFDICFAHPNCGKRLIFCIIAR